jgi:hypothetical protein
MVILQELLMIIHYGWFSAYRSYIEVRINWCVRTKMSPQIGATCQVVVRGIEVWKKF